jgi:hypothetical protein
MIDLAEFVRPVDANSTTAKPSSDGRVVIDAKNAAQGLGKLAVAIVNLLHELLERQAMRRMDNGTLTDEQIERLGDCLMKQSEAIDVLCQTFEISRHELNLDLGPLGKLI